jgi:hypothetical protein
MEELLTHCNGKFSLMTNPAINASRWSKSLSLCDQCRIDMRIFIDANIVSATVVKRDEEIASLSMAILGRVGRLVSTGSAYPLRFKFRAGADVDEQEIEATMTVDDAGQPLLQVTTRLQSDEENELATPLTLLD